MTKENPSPFGALEDHYTMNITSYYEDGKGVATPVWFVEISGKLYVNTRTESHKVKRIQGNARIEIGPADRRGSPLGPTFSAKARVFDLHDTAEPMNEILAAIVEKYTRHSPSMDIRTRFSGEDRIFIEITDG